jgi:hypothetical protein
MFHSNRARSIHWRFIAPLLLTFFLTQAGGCAAFGVIAHALPQHEKAKYSGLAGEKVGVMVWADQGVRIDYPSLQLDLATRVQTALSKSDADELKGTTWPVLPASIVRYQRDHPGIDAMPITTVAPKLGITRLIYIEIEQLSTRSDTSFQMFRGEISSTLKVIEISNGQAKVGYDESGVRAVYPPKAPREGTLKGDDIIMYQGSLVQLTTQVINRLTTHEVD